MSQPDSPSISAATSPRTLKQAAERLRSEAARMEWDGMGQSSVYTKGQQEGLLFAAGMLDRWRKGQGNR